LSADNEVLNIVEPVHASSRKSSGGAMYPITVEYGYFVGLGRIRADRGAGMRVSRRGFGCMHRPPPNSWCP